jgi:hypothetical protein
VHGADLLDDPGVADRAATAHPQVKSWTATTTRPATSVTGRTCQLTHSQGVAPVRQ